MNNILLILTSVLLNAGAQLLIRKGMLKIGEVSFSIDMLKLIPTLASNVFLWIAMLCYMVSLFTWMALLSRVEVSFAYPFLSIGYIISALAAHFLMGESVTPVRIAGIAVICIGVVLISRS